MHASVQLHVASFTLLVELLAVLEEAQSFELGGWGAGKTIVFVCWGSLTSNVMAFAMASLYIFTPRTHARSRVKQSILSVCQSVSQSVICPVKKIEISPHRPSSTIEMESNNSK